MVNDFQLPLVRLRESIGAGGAGVDDNPGMGIERTEEKNLGSEEDRVPATWRQSGLKPLTTSSEPWERAEALSNEAASNCNSLYHCYPRGLLYSRGF